jgi:HK97 gp10 family phage protein
MDDIKIEIPQAELKKALGDFGGFTKEVNNDLQGLITRSTHRVAGNAMRNAPSSFGKLRQSITAKVKGLTGEVAVNVDYAGAVEFGSKPHIIKPRKKKALAFKPGAGFRFWDEKGRVVVKSVKHPGTQAQPFLRPAVEQEASKMLKALKKIVEDAANRNR